MKNYMGGDSSAAEWEFNFVISQDGEEKILSEKVFEFYDKIIELAEESGFFLGGGVHPILDEGMMKDE